MQIDYKTKKLKGVCTNKKIAEKEYGEAMSEKIFQRVQEIEAAYNLSFLLKYKIGGCHSLKGKREGEFSMTLKQPFRLIFTMKDKKLSIVEIINIENYH